MFNAALGPSTTTVALLINETATEQTLAMHQPASAHISPQRANVRLWGTGRIGQEESGRVRGSSEEAIATYGTSAALGRRRPRDVLIPLCLFIRPDHPLEPLQLTLLTGQYCSK